MLVGEMDKARVVRSEALDSPLFSLLGRVYAWIDLSRNDCVDCGCQRHAEGFICMTCAQRQIAASEGEA